jgi:hypothetical protein
MAGYNYASLSTLNELLNEGPKVYIMSPDHDSYIDYGALLSPRSSFSSLSSVCNYLGTCEFYHSPLPHVIVYIY